MKINWIEFENLDTGLKINKTEFYNDLTVMVGLSGAGKTQILNAIKTLCALATKTYSDRHLVKINASMCFKINNQEYVWTIKTNTLKDTQSYPDKNSIVFSSSFIRILEDANVEENIIYEKLTVDNNRIFERDEKKTFFEGYDELPNSNGDISLIYQYRTHERLKDVYSHLNKLYQFHEFYGYEISKESLNKLNVINETLQKCKTNEDYVNMFPQNYPIAAKVYLLQKTNLKTFKRIIRIYQEAFPEIENIIVSSRNDDSDIITIFFETQTSKIDIRDLSSGMQKTFTFLLDIFTVSSDYVFLIDEIENSLGINCINYVYSYVYRFRHDLQFIITSHHPYIINNIQPEQCKVVNRIDNVIKTYTAQELNLSNDYYDFFDVIINKLKAGDIS